MMKAGRNQKGNGDQGWETERRRDGGTEVQRYRKNPLSNISPSPYLSVFPTLRLSVSHSPCPIPHSLLALFVLFAFFASALAQDRPKSPPPASSPATSKAEGSSDRLFRLTLPPLSEAGPGASQKSGHVPMTSDESRSEVKKLWSEAEDLRATGAVESLRAAMSKYEEALRMLRSAGQAAEPGEIAYTLNQLAAVADSLDDRWQAINYYNQALPLWRAANERQSEAATLTRLGRVYNSLGDKQQARRLFEQARLIIQASSLMRTAGDENRAASATFNLGKIYEEQGQPQEAIEQYQKALTMWRAAEDRQGEASALNSLGGLAARAGQVDQAVQLFQQSLPLWRAA